MKVSFRTSRLRDDFNHRGRLKARYGAEMAKVIARRRDDLEAARSLDDLRNLPGRLHELRGDRCGQLSLDLRGPYRLLLTPDRSPGSGTVNGRLDWSKVSAVTIIGVEDTHD